MARLTDRKRAAALKDIITRMEAGGFEVAEENKIYVALAERENAEEEGATWRTKTMHEILFRGKRVDNGEWAESPYPYGTMSSGVVQHDYISQTVGQYTGLTDKNGVKIFEGDIVKGTAYSAKFVGIIVWIDEIGGFGVRYRKRQEATAWENSSILKCASKGRTDEFTAEIIGNIYDNPELIKEDNK